MITFDVDASSAIFEIRRSLAVIREAELRIERRQREALARWEDDGGAVR